MNGRIKIAYVINNLNIGGAEKLLLETVRRLDSSKYNIFVYSLLPGDQLLPEFRNTGCRIVLLNLKHKRAISGLWKLYYGFKSEQVQIVHTHLCEADIYGRYAALLARVPVILSTEHTIEPWKQNPKTLKSRLRIKLDKIAARLTTRTIAVSDNVESFIEQYLGSTVKKTLVIRNGITLPEASQITTNRSQKPIVLGSVGRLAQAKGHKFLLKAFSEINKTRQGIQLHIAGDGPLKNELLALAKSLGIKKNVCFLGTLKDINSFLEKIDVFVLPSVQEGIPLALLEAMAAQKPVIASKIGGVPEVITHNENGLLVKPANVNALIEAIDKAIRSKNLRTKLAAQAKATVVKEFNIVNTIQRLDRLYDQLLFEFALYLKNGHLK